MENLAAVDLNLLVALDALLFERNVTRAAARVGLSQSGMSNALRRLRALFDDPLLVRTAEGMLPTERAQRLGPPIRTALQTIRSALDDTEAFDPSTSRRRVRIGTADYVELVIIPHLIRRLTESAPGITLQLLPLSDGIRAEDLRSGRYDLIIGSDAEPVPPLHHQHLFDEQFVCITRDPHPVVNKRLSLRQFTELSHVLVAPNNDTRGLIDQVLAAQGMQRHIAMLTPHFVTAPIVVARSDYVATVPRRIAEDLADVLPLKVHRPPLEVSGFPLRMVWHNRTDAEPAFSWLRAQISAVCADL